MKFGVCTLAGMVGGVFAAMFGGWNHAVAALLVFMVMDYGSGLMVAGIFHTSPKSAGGGLDSRVGWKGLSRKVMTLMLVAAAHWADVLLGMQYLRDAVVIGFAVNELISILENAALTGLNIPKVLTDALDQIQQGGHV